MFSSACDHFYIRLLATSAQQFIYNNMIFLNFLWFVWRASQFKQYLLYFSMNPLITIAIYSHSAIAMLNCTRMECQKPVYPSNFPRSNNSKNEKEIESQNICWRYEIKDILFRIMPFLHKIGIFIDLEWDSKELPPEKVWRSLQIFYFVSNIFYIYNKLPTHFQLYNMSLRHTKNKQKGEIGKVCNFFYFYAPTILWSNSAILRVPSLLSLLFCTIQYIWKKLNLHGKYCFALNTTIAHEEADTCIV